MRRTYIVTNTKKCILAAALVMTLSGCPARPDPLSAEYHVRVDADRLLNEEVSIFDIFSDVKVVSLDSRCPLSNTVYAGMSNLAFDGDFFYILDTKTSDICVFEEDGTLVSRVDKTGRGPGEYVMADQLAYNPSADAVEVLGLHDVVFEYEITSNRVDCFSVIGIAREASAAFRKEFRPPVVTPTGNDEDVQYVWYGSFYVRRTGNPGIKR